MNLELANKSVVVTSGGSNIGRTIVLVFAQEGVNITIGDLDEAQASKVAKLVLGSDEASRSAGARLVRTRQRLRPAAA